MSLILKQEPANTIATPPAGKSTLFVNDSSVMSIKSPDGNVTTFPTVTGSNTQVFFNDNGAINGNANLTFNKTTATMSVTNLSVTGNLNAGDINVSSIANGTSNVDIIGASGNVTTSVGGVANVLVVTTTGTNVTGTFSASGNANAGNLGTTGVFATTLSASGNSNVGNLGVSGGVIATTLSGSLVTGAQPNITSTGTLTSVSVSGNANVGNLGTGGLINATGNITGGNLTTGGVVSATGNGTFGNINTSGTETATRFISNIATGTAPLTVTSTTRVANLNVDYANVADNINVTAGTGNNFIIFANAATGNVAEITSTGLTANLSNNSITATTFVGALSGAATSATTAGTVTTAAQPNITSTGTLTSVSVSGNANIGNVGTTGVFATTLSATGNANVGNIGATGGVFTTVAGSLTTASQPNITSLGTLTSASISGNANIGNIGTAGLITATGNLGAGNINTGGVVSATGNVTGGNLVTAGILSVTGTGVSSIAGNLDMTSNTIINLASPTNSSDAATKQYVDDVAQGLNIHPSCNAATTTTLASISGGTVTYNNGTDGVGATLTTTGSYTTIDGVTLSNGMRILVKNEATQANNGIYVRTSSTVLTRATDFDSAVEISGGDFTFVTAGTLYNSTGWVQIDEVTTVGTDPIVWEQFSGAGTYQAGTGLTLTGTTFSVNASQTQVTTVGTLTSLSISGNANVGNVGAAAGVFTTLAGSLTTTAQPNITSVGTLTSLSISGNATVGNLNTAGAVVASTLTSNVATGTAPLTVTSTTRVGNLNVAQANVADFISVSAGTGNNFLIFANAATGNITELTSTGLTANLSNNSITATTFVGALSGAATTAGTVTTNAQANITSVGTLASLSVSGNANVGNIGAGAGIYTTLSASGNVTGGNLVSTGQVGGTGATHLGNTFTTGANTTVGTVTGNFALSTGSRFQATYA